MNAPGQRPSLEGRTLGGYRVLEPLGRGNMGIVYRARQTSLHRDVALKVIHEEAAGDETLARRFRRESQIHLQLSHPNLVTVYDAGVEDGRSYLAMELVTGRSLDRYLAVRGPVPLGGLIPAAMGLAEALAYLHGEGVLHRDLKPANVLVADSGEVKIADFGLARKDAQTLLTTDNVLFGTVLYTAPEVYQGAPAGAPADVYALGLVLFEMLTGRTIVPLGGVRETIEAILNDPIPTPTRMGRADTPPDLEDLVMEMIDKDAPARPTSRQVASRLAGMAPGLPPAQFQRPLHPSHLDPVLPAGAPAEASRRTRRTTDPRLEVGPAPELVTPAGPGALASLGGSTTSIVTVRTLDSERRALAAVMVLGTAMGLGLGVRLGSSIVPAGDPVPSPVASSAGPAAPGAGTAGRRDEAIHWMRSQLVEITRLLERYDRESPPIEDDADAGLLREGVFHDAFHRARPGDLNLVFTALSKVTDVVRRGDDDHIEDLVWIDVEQVVFDAVEETARSHGFDERSVLNRPVTRLEQRIAARSDTPLRQLLARSILPGYAHFRTISSEALFERVRIQEEEVLPRLLVLPGTWRTSPGGQRILLSVHHRVAEIWSTLGLIDRSSRQDEARERGKRARRATVEFARDHVDLEDERPSPHLGEIRRLTFHAAVSVLPDAGNDPELRRHCVSVIHRLWRSLDLDRVRPRIRTIARRDLAVLREQLDLGPPVGLDPDMVDRLGRWVESGPAAGP